MGYNFYVTRRQNHFDEVGAEITEEEWRTLVERDPELTFNDPHNPLLATWSGESRYPNPWFHHRHGSIETKNPDPPIIVKMLRIAAELHAKVQGDDCEVYHSPTETFFEDTSQRSNRP